MAAHVEAGRAGRRDRTSDYILAGIVSEVPQNPVLFNQARHIAGRFAVGDALARCLAEHAFDKGRQR